MIECLLSMCEALSLISSNIHTHTHNFFLEAWDVAQWESTYPVCLGSIPITTEGKKKHGRQDSYPGPSGSPSMSLMKQINVEKSLEIFIILLREYCSGWWEVLFF